LREREFERESLIERVFKRERERAFKGESLRQREFKRERV
jgi:hypothetical protein